MPKVTVTDKKGLVQSAGTTVDFQNTVLVSGNFANVIKVASLTGAGATKTLTAADSGTLVILNGSDASTVTLPGVANGLHFKIIAGSAYAHVIQGATDVLQGCVWDNSDGATLARTAIADKGKITLANPAIGDHITVISNGTNWYVEGWLNDTPSLGTL
tara:strand:+ start:789 stop:1265 length:477 start_codon:yes stop_codon:yes gene_type:complete